MNEETEILEPHLRFVAALHEATRLDLVQWETQTDSPNRDIYHGSIDGEVVEVEFESVPSLDGRTAERMFVRMAGLGAYVQAALGTPIYEAIESMLALQVFGWKEGRAAAERRIAKAIARIEERCRSAIKRGGTVERGEDL